MQKNIKQWWSDLKSFDWKMYLALCLLALVPAINKDGTIHEKGHGIPNLNKKVLDWLNKNGWCLNGVKY
jgi:hypothetical protein